MAKIDQLGLFAPEPPPKKGSYEAIAARGASSKRARLMRRLGSAVREKKEGGVRKPLVVLQLAKPIVIDAGDSHRTAKCTKCRSVVPEGNFCLNCSAILKSLIPKSSLTGVPESNPADDAIIARALAVYDEYLAAVRLRREEERRIYKEEGREVRRPLTEKQMAYFTPRLILPKPIGGISLYSADIAENFGWELSDDGLHVAGGIIKASKVSNIEISLMDAARYAASVGKLFVMVGEKPLIRRGRSNGKGRGRFGSRAAGSASLAKTEKDARDAFREIAGDRSAYYGPSVTEWSKYLFDSNGRSFGGSNKKGEDRSAMQKRVEEKFATDLLGVETLADFATAVTMRKVFAERSVALLAKIPPQLRRLAPHCDHHGIDGFPTIKSALLDDLG